MMRFFWVLALCVLFGTWFVRSEKTNRIVIKTRPEVSIEDLCASHPLVKFERASILPRVLVFSVENIEHVEAVSDATL